ncbi:hypothetical protein AJ80_00839 [Polytolypa hystricis UAMH7299]|uniref:Uncharacterized protein n=1 Tax=Polytolypa hystricis (strain UAMH7299) TaxID=1447883 RepID=A0A2B7Z220_POLH7|nr:hypothetical protein AJ80_00839 [Polytolypa hystricis UAMH7299]
MSMSDRDYHSPDIGSNGHPAENEDADRRSNNFSLISVKQNHLSDSPSLSAKPLLTPSIKDCAYGPHSPPFGYKLRHFWLRASAGLVVPPLVTGYYVFLVKYYLLVQDEDKNQLRVGPAGANLAFWSWRFRASRYGLVGAEAGMLMYHRWLGPRDALQLMMHADRTWSGPSGWIKILHKVPLLRKRDNVGDRAPEVGDGCIVQMPNAGTPKVTVLGRNYSSFNFRGAVNDITDEAVGSWKSATPVRVPGLGVMYTRPGVRRSDYHFLSNFPNAFPPDSGVPEIFLAPQAPFPVSGTTWGLVVRYNRTSVDKISDFTILNRFYEYGNNTITNSGNETDSEIIQPIRHLIGDDVILIGDHRPIYRLRNYQAVSELGSSNYKGGAFYTTQSGLDKEHVLEYILHQSLPKIFPPRRKLANYIYRKLSDKHEPMQFAVGVRCTSSFDTGVAYVDSQTNSFTNFSTVYPVPSNPIFDEAVEIYPLGIGVGNMIVLTMPQPRDRRLGGLKSKQLRSSFPQAFATYSLQLAYDGAGKYDDIAHYLSFSNSSSGGPTAKQLLSRGFFGHENYTLTVPRKVLTRGPIKTAWLPLYLFVPWALGSMALVLAYSFRRRWSETFDGYSLFRFGADYADQVRDRPEFLSTEDYEKCDSLRNIPGRIGDARPLFVPGHISLVKNSVASREKLYL